MDQIKQHKRLVKDVRKQINKVEKMINDLRLVVIETEAHHLGITAKDANRSITRVTKKSKRRISLQLEEGFENYTEAKFT